MSNILLVITITKPPVTLTLANSAGGLEDVDPNDNAGDFSDDLRSPAGCEGDTEASGGDAKSESRAGDESRIYVIERDLEDDVGESCGNETGASLAGSGGSGSCVRSELDSVHSATRDG